ARNKTMRASMPVSQATAILSGRYFTGRYRKAPFWRPGKFHVEMSIDDRRIWVLMTKAEMETDEFRKHLGDNLRECPHHWSKAMLDEAYIVLVKCKQAILQAWYRLRRVG